MTYLFDMVPGLLPLFDLFLGLVQLSKESSHVASAAAAAAGGQAAENWGRTWGKVAANKVPNTAGTSIQSWRGKSQCD